MSGTRIRKQQIGVGPQAARGGLWESGVWGRWGGPCGAQRVGLRLAGGQAPASQAEEQHVQRPKFRGGKGLRGDA